MTDNKRTVEFLEELPKDAVVIHYYLGYYFDRFNPITKDYEPCYWLDAENKKVIVKSRGKYRVLKVGKQKYINKAKDIKEIDTVILIDKDGYNHLISLNKLISKLIPVIKTGSN